MRAFAAAALLVALTVGASGCGSIRRAATTDAILLHVSPATTSLPPGLAQEIDSRRRPGQILRAEVYGPGSRPTLAFASSADRVGETAQERKERFYLIVLHGHFVGFSHPAGTRAPRGTIETEVWSRAEGVTDTGISDRLPAAVTRLHRLATLRLS